MTRKAEQPPTEIAASQAQQELLESCLDLVFDTLDASVAEHILDPVIFVLDCEDELGREIASGWLGAEAVREAVAEQQRQDDSGETTTAYARAVPLAECRREVPVVFPYLAPVFAGDPPADGFLAIAVTAGGASVFTVPMTAREA